MEDGQRNGGRGRGKRGRRANHFQKNGMKNQKTKRAMTGEVLVANLLWERRMEGAGEERAVGAVERGRDRGGAAGREGRAVGELCGWVRRRGVEGEGRW